MQIMHHMLMMSHPVMQGTGELQIDFRLDSRNSPDRIRVGESTCLADVSTSTCGSSDNKIIFLLF